MTTWMFALLSCLVALAPVVASATPAGKIVIAQGVDPTTLDMQNQSESPASNVGRHIFDALWERDQNLKIVPNLATGLPKLVAPTTWEVKLRKGVKFHNGEDFNAESVKFTLERLAGGQGKLRGATFFQPIDHVDIVDAYTVRVHTKKPWPTFAQVHVFVQSGMYSPKEYAGKDSAYISKNPIGTGPYKFVRWAKDDEIIKGVLDGKAMRVATMLPPMHFGYDASLKPIKYDPARSKKLLAEAGFPNGLEVVLNGPQGRYVRDKEVAEAVAGQLTKNGIKTTLRTFEFVNYLNNMVYVHKAGPIWLIGWGTNTMDAETIYVPLFKSGNIFVNWHNDDFNGMLDEAQTIMDDKKRLAQYHKINKLWIEEMPAIPLYQQIDLYGANKRLAWKARSDELIKAYDMALKDGK